MTNSVPESQPSQPGGFSHAAYPHIDKYLTIDGLLKSHAAEEEQSPAICYPAHGVADYEEHSAADIDRYVDVAARFYVQQGLEPAVRLSFKRQTTQDYTDMPCRILLTIKPLSSLFSQHRALRSS